MTHPEHVRHWVDQGWISHRQVDCAGHRHTLMDPQIFKTSKSSHGTALLHGTRIGTSRTNCRDATEFQTLTINKEQKAAGLQATDTMTPLAAPISPIIHSVILTTAPPQRCSNVQVASLLRCAHA
jgi:hypothetical protein